MSTQSSAGTPKCRIPAPARRGMKNVLAFLEAQQSAGDASELFDNIGWRLEKDTDAAIAWLEKLCSGDKS